MSSEKKGQSAHSWYLLLNGKNWLIKVKNIILDRLLSNYLLQFC